MAGGTVFVGATVFVASDSGRMSGSKSSPSESLLSEFSSSPSSPIMSSSSSSSAANLTLLLLDWAVDDSIMVYARRSEVGAPGGGPGGVGVAGAWLGGGGLRKKKNIVGLRK